ncbi:DUF2784 domain-containing protein [Imbroritus primus]|jgi:hypothetical protein|uniref:DUF2784 domain-containing protein n=1 Tax=Imbroritus primus TaxID=3058603 RepID=UPI003D160E0E
MPNAFLYWLADAVLLVHALFVVAVVGGLLLIWIGAWRKWQWVHAWWLRVAHLAAIVFIAGSALIGVACPLTVLEDALRGRTPGANGFIERWVGALLYYDWPTWVFTVLYVGFAALVAVTWIAIPPQRRTGPR